MALPARPHFGSVAGVAGTTGATGAVVDRSAPMSEPGPIPGRYESILVSNAVLRMDSKPNKSDVEARLRDTAEAMSNRFESLQDEVTSTGTDLRSWVVENPVKSVGGMLAAGLAVGLLFGGTRRRRRRRHQKLIDQYLDALTDEIEEEAAAGEEPSQALQKALRDRVPLVVYAGSDRSDGQEAGFVRSLLGEGAGVVVRTALSLVARDLIESMLDDADLGEMVDEESRLS